MRIISILQAVFVVCLIEATLSDAAGSGDAQQSSSQFDVIKVYSSNITINWTVTAMSSYNVTTVASSPAADNNSPIVDEVTDQNQLPLTIMPLQNATVYNITVCEIPTDGQSNLFAFGMVETGPAPPIISGLTSSDTSLLVEWNVIPSAIKYVVVYSSVSNGMEMNKSTEVSNITIDGLQSNTRYSVKVMAEINTTTATDFSDPEVAVTVPGQVMNLSAEVAPTFESSGIVVRWVQPGGDETMNYTVTYQQNDTEEIQNSNGPEATITGLRPGIKYSIRVNASNAGGTGVTSAVEQCTKPNPPQNLIVTSIGLTSVRLTWDATDTIFEVYSSELCNVTNLPISDTWTSHGTFNTNNVTVGNLTANQQYTFAVRAVCEFNGAGKEFSAFSNSACGSTILPPTSITFGEVADNSTEVNLIIEHPLQAARFTVYLKSSDAEDVNHTNMSSTEIISGLKPGANYTVSVLTEGMGGVSDALASGFITVPLPVTNVMLDASTYSIDVTWTPPTNSIFQSQILIYEQSDTDIESSGKETFNDSTTNSFTISDLLSGAKYAVQIYTMSYGEESVYTFDETFTDTNGPSMLMNATQDISRITISWTAPDSTLFNNYILSYHASSDQSNMISVIINDTKATTYQVKNLMAGTFYEFALISSGNSNSTPALGIFATIPAPVVNLTSSHIDSSSLYVEWEAPIGSGFHQFEVLVNGSSDRSLLDNSTFNETLGSLDAGTRYEVTVLVLFGDFASMGQYVILPTAPGQVQNLTVPPVVSTNILISWAAPMQGEVDGYVVTLMHNNTSVVHNTTETSLLVEVESGFNYNVSVEAQLEMAISVPVIATFITAPSPVQNVMAEAINSSSIRVSWDVPTSGNYDNFVVEVNGEIPGVFNNNTTVVIDNLDPGSFYTAIVRSVFMGAESNDTSSMNITTYPGQVTGLNVPASAPTSRVNVSWGEPTGGFDNYTVMLTYNGTSTVQSTTDTSLVLDVSPGYMYNVSVEVVFQGLDGEPSNGSGVVAPLPVDNVMAEATSSSSLNVSWKSPTNGTFDSFLIEAVEADMNSAVNEAVNMTESETLLLTGLKDGTLYNITVQSVSFGVASITSGFDNAPTIPGVVTKLDVPQNETTRTLNISWSLPSEGSADMYKVELLTDYLTEFLSDNLTEYFTSNTTFEADVEYGYRYGVSVSAIFRSLTGESRSMNTSIVPDSVQNLKVMQNDNNQTHSIDLEWDTLMGRGDSIMIKAIPDMIMNMSDDMNTQTRNLSFMDTNTTVDDLIPGTNYTVDVTTLSNSLSSESMQRSISTQPASPVVFNESTTSTTINITWTLPEGNAQRFIVTWSNDENDKAIVNTLNPNEYSHAIVGLTPSTTYDVSISSEITIHNGSSQSSVPTLRSISTPSSPPPTPTVTVDVTTAVTTQTSFEFTLAAGTFSFDNGDIHAYAVFLISSGLAETGDLPDLTNIAPCASNATTNLEQCVAMWTDSDGKLLTPSSFRKKRATNENITFNIGNREITRQPGEDMDFVNPPLAADSGYRVSVAGRTDDSDQLTATMWSSEIKTEPVPVDLDNTVVIVVVVVVVVLLVVAVVIAIICYRRRKQGGKNFDAKEQPTPLKPKEDIQVAMDNKRELQTKARTRSEFLQVFHDFDDEDVTEVLSTEYADLRPVGREQAANAAINNKPKNRYTNILPYDATRVKLQTVDNDPGSDYINANFVPGNSSQQEYIAAQGPLDRTSDDFWRMIWEHNTRDIVMLAKCFEMGKAKCHHYWPKDNDYDPNTVSGMTLQMTSETKASDKWWLREFKLTKGTITRKIRQFQYIKWPDHGVPKPEDMLVNFVKYVRRSIDAETKHFGPTIIHCSAGVGRTGTFIAIDRLLQNLDAGTGQIDIFGLVYQMRLNRNYMVQTEVQYILIHQVVQDYLNGVFKEIDENPEPIYENPIVEDPVYVNTSFSQPTNNSNGNGVVNPALINPSEDAPSSKSRHNSQKPLLKPKPPTKPKSASLAGHGQNSVKKPEKPMKPKKPPIAKPRKSHGSSTTMELVPKNEGNSSSSEDAPVA